jgi:hypothetical protein
MCGGAFSSPITRIEHAAGERRLDPLLTTIHGKGLSIMQLSGMSFSTTEWSGIERTEHPGEAGLAYWQTRHFGNVRVRMVEYTPGYLADHWCTKGHILLCIEGELHTELEDGRKFMLRPGMSYQVADNAEPHRSSTGTGARLFIVD